MNDQHWAVVVGIDRYPAIRSLSKARRDAEAFRDWLLDPQGGALPAANVYPVIVPDAELPEPLDRTEAKPRFDDVAGALDAAWAACEAHVAQHPEDWQGTRLYFYASGHGIAPSPTEAALLLADAGPPRYFGENLSCNRFLEYFRAAQPFRELVFFADCCREPYPAARPRGPIWDEVVGNNGEVRFLPGYATAPNQLAYEGRDPERLSSFTQAVLEGLRGQAEVNGVVDSNGLAVYVRRRVLELSGDQQIPQMPSDPAAPIVFRRAAVAAGHRVEVLLPQGFAGVVEIRDGTGRTLATHDAAAGPWRGELANGLYEVVPAGGAGPSPFAAGGIFKVFGGGRAVQL